MSEMLENPFDVIFCRICLKVSGVMVDIFEKVDEDQFSIQHMLLACAGLVVDSTDAHSNFLCEECSSELLISFKFHTKCEHIKQIMQETAIELDGTSTKSTKNDILQQLVEDLDIELPHQQITIPANEEHQEQENEITVLEELLVEQEENVPSVFLCDVCGATFERKYNLNRHIENFHPKEKIFKCVICNYTTRSNESYNCHISKCNPTDENANLKYVCIFCGKSLISKSALETHLRVHTNKRPFNCDICSKTFKTNSSLKNHKQRHTSAPQYCCTLCKKNFYEKGNLKIHMRSHTGEKLQKCPECGKQFARVFLLQLHRRVHTGEKPYMCQVCHRSFKQSGDLYKHQFVHANHECVSCGKKFNKRYELKQHMHEGCTVDENELDSDALIEVNYSDVLC